MRLKNEMAPVNLSAFAQQWSENGQFLLLMLSELTFPPFHWYIEITQCQKWVSIDE